MRAYGVHIGEIALHKDCDAFFYYKSERGNKMGKREQITKYILFTLVGLLLSAAIELFALQDVFAASDVVVVNATNVNVRSQANTTSKSYGKVSKGTMLKRSEERPDGWSCIDYAGKKAYIKSEFLTTYSSGVASAPITSATDASSLGAATSTAATTASAAAVASVPVIDKSQPSSSGGTVWVSRTGSKYHRSSSCSNMKSPTPMSESEAINAGYEPCKKCCR